MKSWPENRRLIGQPLPRSDAPEKVTGRAQYAYDVQPEGWLYGMILRSRWPAAIVEEVDLSAARKLRGVVAAIPARESMPIRVRYYGQEIAAVAATSKQVAMDALAAIKVRAEKLSHVVKELDAVHPRAPEVFDDNANLSDPAIETQGDPEAAFASAAASIESYYATQIQIHHPMETHGNTVAFDGETCTCWASTQSIFALRDSIAQSLGIPESKVEVICQHMGGGFGAKYGGGVECVLAALLSRQAGGRPVKLMLPRFDQALAVGNRPSTFQKVALAADGNGQITGYRMDGFGCAGYAGGASTGAGGGGARFVSNYLYEAPHRVVKQASVAINAGSGRAFRAPGHPPGCFSMEGLMDDLALQLGRDPLAFRLQNDPSPIRRKQFELGAERFDWKGRYRAPGSSPGPLKTGIGCAGATWWGGGTDNQCEARINRDGTAEIRIGSQDIGTGTRTIIRQVAAEILQIGLDRVTVHLGSTTYPPSVGSGGSMTAASVAPSTAMAAYHAREKLVKQSGFDDLSAENWDDACATLTGGPIVALGEWNEALRSGGTTAAQFAEVSVDTETGVVKVHHVLAVQDGGLILNPLTTRSQVNGGILMGIGYALFEERVMDERSGVVLNPNYETYKLVGMADVPQIDVILLDFPERGVIGIGEPVHIPTAAAIANAVANALGVRVHEIPITPDRVLSALGQTGEDAYQLRRQALRRAFEHFGEVALQPTPTAINPFTRLV